MAPGLAGRPIMAPRRLILRNFLSPGDLVMLTAAVRDLHCGHPGRFLTDVRTSCPELWEHNPHLTPLREDDPQAEVIDCQYPLIDRADQVPLHCLHGFAEFLGTRLGLNLRPTLFHGDIHLSDEERRWKSTVHELAGLDLPFWIVNAGGKFDYTAKWWDVRRHQRVVDHFRGKILFVQVGELGHHHPPLRHVVDLRGKTDLRQLIRLVHHAQGVLCGVTALMHLAAAVPRRVDRPAARAAVVIAGGREPTHWEAYPHHQFIHTIGALRCCATGGCWRARVRPLGDGESSDQPENLCVDVAGKLPRCLDMITAAEVVRRIEIYFQGGALDCLTSRQARAAERAIQLSLVGSRFEETINLVTAPAALDRAAREARRDRAPAMCGRGVIFLANTGEEAAQALESIRHLRARHHELPVELWCIPPLAPRVAKRGRAWGVVVQRGPADATGAELRWHALLHTKLREVAVIGPGAPVAGPMEKIFERPPFQKTGAVFLGRHRNPARPGVWKLCELEMPRHTVGTGVMWIDRQRCWSALQLVRWIVRHYYFFHGYVDGDGGAAQLAFQKLAQPLSILTPRALPL